MNEIHSLAKILIFSGILLFTIGLLFLAGDKIPFIGKLPGDIYVQKKNFTFFFPIGTSIVFSLILSLILWLVNRK